MTRNLVWVSGAELKAWTSKLTCADMLLCPYPCQLTTSPHHMQSIQCNQWASGSMALFRRSKNKLQFINANTVYCQIWTTFWHSLLEWHCHCLLVFDKGYYNVKIHDQVQRKYLIKLSPYFWISGNHCKGLVLICWCIEHN